MIGVRWPRGPRPRRWPRPAPSALLTALLPAALTAAGVTAPGTAVATAAAPSGPPPVTVLTPGARNGNGDIFIAPFGDAGTYANGPEIITPTGRIVWFHAVPAGQEAAAAVPASFARPLPSSVNENRVDIRDPYVKLNLL